MWHLQTIPIPPPPQINTIFLNVFQAYSDLAKFMSKPEVETGLALHGPLLERFAQVTNN